LLIEGGSGWKNFDQLGLMHILFLTDNFPPEVNAPASRTFEHTREWIKAGHSVTIITCAPNFPKGKVFEGYHNRLWQSEIMDGVRVIRVWSYITANDGFFGRILDYVSFMVMSTVGSFLIPNVDVVIGTSPQFFTVCGAYFVSRFKHIPFVFELRDLWPESIKAVGAMKNSIILSSLEWIEAYLYRAADAIVPVTHSFKRRLIERGIAGEKIHVVTNGVNLSHFFGSGRDCDLIRKLGLENHFICGYIGTHGMAHGLETLLDSAEQLLRQGHSDVCILFIGDGARKAILKADAENRRITNVIFIDTVPKVEVVRYWSLLDASIVHLRPSEVFSNVIPSKIFESMAMGIPLLHGVPGESTEIVVREKVGLVFNSGDHQSLCDAILYMKANRQLFDFYRGRCLEAALKYSRLRLAADLLSVLEMVVQVPSAKVD
jgi:glycosyltransferase involved in cell wall biosynthesis